MSKKSTGLLGSYTLNAETVDKKVTRTSPGAYALGKLRETTFIVKYIGRSDTDVNSRLKDWIGKYPYFKFIYYGSAKAAFEKECNLYHDWGESKSLDNDIHPQRPAGTNWKCPRCNIFD